MKGRAPPISDTPFPPFVWINQKSATWLRFVGTHCMLGTSQAGGPLASGWDRLVGKTDKAQLSHEMVRRIWGE